MKFRSCLFAGLAGLSLTAVAADTSPPTQGSTLTVGAGLGVAPRFPGSKKTQLGAVPLLDYQHESGFFAGTRRGIGWGGEDGPLTYSLAVAGRGERDDREHKLLGLGGGGKELAGMGKVPASALGTFNLGMRLGRMAELNAALELPLTHRENGRALHLGASLALLQARQDTLALSTGLHHGDTKYLRTYFGVTPQQSQNSGYAAYTPKSGFYQADLGLSWNHKFDEHWSLTGMTGVNHLLGDAGKSPLARRKTAPEGGLLVTYTY